MQFPVVRFKKDLLVQAMLYGEQRSQASVHRKDNWGLKVTNDPASQIEDARRQTIGTLGEWAVANFFGIAYEFTVNSFKAPDVYVTGRNEKVWGLQVKASEYGKNFIIRSDAKNHEPYIYCKVEMPAGDPRQYAATLPDNAVARVTIMGWMFPSEARERARANPALIRDPGNRNSPAIFIPVEQIRPIQELMEVIG